MTTITTRTASLVPAHRVAVVSDGFEYLAECCCGWASDWQATPEAADRAGVEHIDSAVGPPDGLDRAMTELLDLQDDLAATVVWLAENWSADLPAPCVNSTTHYGDAEDSGGKAGVRLLVPCGNDTVELARAAACFGAPIIDDPANDEGRDRYRRATLALGRVHIQAYAPLGETAP
jgi:hypothetical protein